MVDFEKFGCQAPFQECNMSEKYKEMYENSGLEIFNIPPPRVMKACISAQKRLRELAAFKNCTYEELLQKYSEAETGNCPFYVLVCEDSAKIPTLLE